jgi:hypothetical protein
MTRQEKIHEVANTIDPNIGKEWIEKDFNKFLLDNLIQELQEKLEE